ncbi:MFS transporter [Paractinoplanes durhamensis]|uniref:MFS transporter n=1 Tax=Paractinoplanes durhamensis TaxID=113563 RepID=A0ABQ3Z5G0_9ACTN|nr:MFS transporter [Actinoplanes durhamensis]GIE05026.1 hypothetical protein Adu01nite_63760 [Actinoplanes durhamensis]
MKALVDLRPLRENRTFRRLWIGSTASGFGGQFGGFAAVYYLWDTTHRAVVVGLLGLAVAAPLILLSLAGSAFIDHVDRRRLAMRCAGGQILISSAMTAVVFTGVGGVPAVLVATLLAMPIALFPVLNAELFGDRPEVLGLFTTALAVGGVTASVLSGLATRRPHPGRLMLACGAVWALALGGLGLVHPGPGMIGVVLLLIAVAGAADTWAVVARGTVVQSTTPDAYRGRVSALEAMVGEAGPQLGNLRAGLVATATSGGAALAIGGASALAATALIAVSTPALRRFTVPDEGALTGSDLHG